MEKITTSVNQAPKSPGQVDKKLEPSTAAIVQAPELPWDHLSPEAFG